MVFKLSFYTASAALRRWCFSLADVAEHGCFRDQQWAAVDPKLSLELPQNGRSGLSVRRPPIPPRYLGRGLVGNGKSDYVHGGGAPRYRLRAISPSRVSIFC